MSGANLVDEVTCAEPYHWLEGGGPQWYRARQPNGSRESGVSNQESAPDARLPTPDSCGGVSAPLVVAYDFGIKRNILRMMVDRGLRVAVVPAQTSAEEVLAMKPGGVFLSNGPGDPAAVTYAIENVRKLLGKSPLFGICLGHQILALALGGRTEKMRFGHRGGNQPVKNLLTGVVEISSHNHGFVVSDDSQLSGAEVTHVNLNDNTIEGLRHPELGAFSVQFHPEASPGPHDSLYLFDEFVKKVVSS
jgi:carbamoyl-phosphate synthase small subunit